MGTRRSRHNKGRKPLYKEFRRGLETHTQAEERAREEAHGILSRGARYGGLPHLGYRLWWTAEDDGDLAVCAFAEANIEQVAEALARQPKAIASRLRDAGIWIPPEWRSLLWKAPAKPRLARPNEILAYPYLTTARDEHADLIRINALVPKGFAPEMRSDICQSIMLAVLEGEITIDEIQENKEKMAWFVSKFRREQSPYQEMSLAGDGDDRRSYDEIAASGSAFNAELVEDEIRGALNALGAQSSRYTRATQVDEIYDREIYATRSRAPFEEQFRPRSEVEKEVASGIWSAPIGTVATRTHFQHAIQRAKERYGVQLSYRDLKTIGDFCATIQPRWSDVQGDCYRVKWRGQPMTLMINPASGHVITFLPLAMSTEDHAERKRLRLADI